MMKQCSDRVKRQERNITEGGEKQNQSKGK